MRATLSNSVRPRLGQAQLTLSHGPDIKPRRIAILSLGHTLAGSEAVTTLPAPVLTTASVLDVTQKDQRGCDLEQKITKVQREIDTFRERGLKSWNTQRTRSVWTINMHKRRAYSTMTSTSNAQFSSSEAHQENKEKSDNSLPSVSDLHKYENLLATKLGLQLLLYISTGRSPSPRLSTEFLSDDLVQLDSLESLMNRLKAVNKALAELDQSLPSASTDFIFEDSGSALDSEISSLTWQCRTGRISITDLIYGYTRAVVHSRTGLSLQTYRNVAETFSTLDADVLTSIAMFPYFKTRQVLSDRSIFSIIYQYGKLKDVRRLDRFLQRLTQSDRGFRIANEWEHVTVNGIVVPTPVNRRHRILDLLVRTALQADQPHKAKAWATLLVQEGAAVGRMVNLFNNFLTYCSRQANWAYGELWLQRAIAWAALFAQTSPWMLSKLIYRMLDLCTSCGKVQLYNNILDAAVAAGLTAPPIDESRPDTRSEQAQTVFKEWKARLNQAGNTSPTPAQVMEATIVFQENMAKVEPAITDFIGVTDMRKLKSLMNHVSEQVNLRAVEANVAQSKQDLEVKSWTKFDQLESPDRLLAANIVERASPKSQLTTTYRPGTDYAQLSDTNEFGNILFEYDQGDNSSPTLSPEHGFRYWNQASNSVEDSLAAQQAEAIKAENSYLAAQLEISFEKERELTKSIEQLKVQLSAGSRKSLETVFLEKENFNIRFEMRELSTRYRAALNETEQVQQEVSTARAELKRLERRMSADMDALHCQNMRLQEQLAQANSLSEKRLQASRAREGNLQKILLTNEERVSSLRDEIARLKSTNVQHTSDSGSIETPIEDIKQTQDTNGNAAKRRFTLRTWQRSGSELTGRDRSDGTPWSIPSS